MTTKLHLGLIPWGCKARGVVHSDYIVLHFQKNTTLCKIGKSRGAAFAFPKWNSKSLKMS